MVSEPRNTICGAVALRLALLALACASLAACAGGPRPAPVTVQTRGTMRPYEVNGVWYRPEAQPNYDKVGLASWYGPQSRYHTTADGEPFDPRVATAAHKTLPLPCIVEVTNLDNGRQARLRVNDRGPFVSGRILDVSRAGAEELGFLGAGVARVRVRYIGPAPGAAADSRLAALPRTDETASIAPGAAPPAYGQEGPAQTMETYATAATAPAANPAAPPRMQAATFSVRANAERAAATLAETGEVVIEPAGDEARPLWRVIVTARAGQSAEDLRDRLAAAGFPGAVSLGGE